MNHFRFERYKLRQAIRRLAHSHSPRDRRKLQVIRGIVRVAAKLARGRDKLAILRAMLAANSDAKFFKLAEEYLKSALRQVRP